MENTMQLEELNNYVKIAAIISHKGTSYQVTIEDNELGYRVSKATLLETEESIEDKELEQLLINFTLKNINQ